MFLNVFSIAFFIVFVVGICSRYVKHGKKVFCIFSGVIYFLLAALRSESVGGDTTNYVYIFRRVASMDWKVVIANWDNDPMFWGLLSVLGKITLNYTVLFTIVAAFFTVSIWFFIYKYSKDPLMSIIVLLAMNLYQFSLTGMRQTIAMSFIVWVIILLDQNKIKSALLLVIIAGLFHSSALIFLIVIIMKKVKINNFTLLLSVPVLISSFLFRGNIANRLMVFIDERGYEIENTESGLTMTFVIFILYILAVVFAHEYVDNKRSLYLQYGIAALAVFFEMLVPVQRIYFRIAFYFLMIYIILIPNVLCAIRNKRTQVLIRMGIYILLIIQYLFFTINSCYILPYTTFWQKK